VTRGGQTTRTSVIDVVRKWGSERGTTRRSGNGGGSSILAIKGFDGFVESSGGGAFFVAFVFATEGFVRLKGEGGGGLPRGEIRSGEVDGRVFWWEIERDGKRGVRRSAAFEVMIGGGRQIVEVVEFECVGEAWGSGSRCTGERARWAARGRGKGRIGRFMRED
jgi:hypothetical protein